MSDNAVTIKNDNAVVTADFVAKANKYLQLCGQQVSPAETQQFIEICSELQLNPFKREIYGIPFKGKLQIVTGYETYLKRAERTGKLNGVKMRYEPEGNDLKCIVEIYRKDWTMPFVHEVYMSEYNTRNNLWASKPKTMLRKVAMSQAYRMAFPDEFAGMPYTQEETPVNDIPTKTIKTEDGSSYEIVDEQAMQQKPQAQTQDTAKQIGEAITLIWQTVNKHNMTENDVSYLRGYLSDKANHTKVKLGQILTWIQQKPLKSA
ncbi:MAG: phage recombination protein Bet [Spirochaetales bacterium]|nr:phage recombination protein Bet [Spirochaetales bacterium]